MKVISGLLPETWDYFCMKNCISTTRNCHSHIHESRRFILFALLKVHPRLLFPLLAYGLPNSWALGRLPGWSPSKWECLFLLHLYVWLFCWMTWSYDHILAGATRFFSFEVSDRHVMFVWFLIHRGLLVLAAFVCRIILLNCLIIQSYDHMLADATRFYSYSLIVVWYLFAFWYYTGDLRYLIYAVSWFCVTLLRCNGHYSVKLPDLT
jgi:hypothetical protein